MSSDPTNKANCNSRLCQSAQPRSQASSVLLTLCARCNSMRVGPGAQYVFPTQHETKHQNGKHLPGIFFLLIGML